MGRAQALVTHKPPLKAGLPLANFGHSFICNDEGLRLKWRVFENGGLAAERNGVVVIARTASW